MIRALKIRGVNVVNHQKKNELIEIKAVRKRNILEPELKSPKKFEVSKSSKVFKNIKKTLEGRDKI